MTHYQITPLAVTTAFYAAYLSKQLVLRRRGIKSDRLAKGDKPLRVYRVEAALLVVTFTMPIAQYVGILFQPRFFGPIEPHLLFRAAGIVVSAAGTAFFIAAVAAMRENWRAGIDPADRTEIVTTGVYRWSRNPAFVGFDLFYIGIALIFPSVLLIILTLCGIVLFHLQILNEERYLEGAFGPSYTLYKRRTRRY